MSAVHKDDNSNEWFFLADQYILSETDSKGIILYANDLFCQMAGYSLNELIGEAHNIVRHPDMPRIAFKGLWDDLREKGFWTGIVKNLRRDGGYYWVHATALRRLQSNGEVTYLSIRTVPKRSDVEACIKLYAKLKQEE